MYSYKSEATLMLNQFLEEHPEEAAQRLKNRALLWDREQNPFDESQQAEKIARGAYAYYQW